MARKKKEESKVELVTPETAATTVSVEQTAPIAVEEKTAKEVKKTTKKSVKKPAKKVTAKTKTKTEEQEKTEPKQEVVTEEKEQVIVTKLTPPTPKRERKTPVKKAEEKTVTRAEKNETIKSLIKELLSARPYKWSELLDESARKYEQKIEEKDGHVANDVRGRVGSVFDVMKKDGEVTFEGGMYALKQTADKKIEEHPLAKNEEQKPEKPEEKVENTEKQPPVLKEKTEVAPVFDMSLLLGDKTNPAKQEKKTEEL